MIFLNGINASPGIAIGPALVLDTEEYRIPRRSVEAAQVPRQVAMLDSAIEAARQEVADLRAAAARKLGNNTAAIFEFHEKFIAEPKLRQAVVEMIENDHFSAAYAFGLELNRRQKLFQSVANAYLKERVRDLYDIEKRVLRHILGRAREDISKLTEPVVIVSNDITPSQAVSLNRALILGFAINVGGSTSHTAIIARMLGIPAVVALEHVTRDISGGETVIIDGTHGVVIANPDQETVDKFRLKREKYRKFVIGLRGLRDEPSVTQDNTTISLMANIELPNEVETAKEAGAEGVGLYRTEFLYLASTQMPTEEQQYEAFASVVRTSGERPVVIRTIDLGAEKMRDYLGPSDEHNPVLGLRSLRYCLRNLDMFKTHLRAILRAALLGDVRIMFPMITTLMELRQAKATLADVVEDLEEEGIPCKRDLPIGIMVETPAAAMLSAAFAKEVQFMSIGTNDLTQYTLAVDRSNERVSHLYCPHNPAVLRLIKEVVQNARRADIAVNLCGEMAGTPLYTQMLIGLGLRQLSMAPQDILEVKKVIRSTTLKRCQAIARKVLRFDADRQVLNFLRDETRKILPEAV